jgi:L-malate glycosyltransferase
LRVLFVNHTGTVSGAEISLVDLIAGMPSEVQGVIACPEGDLAENLRALRMDVHTIPAIDASLRFHPVHTPVGVVQLARSSLSLRRAARLHGVDIVHANSLRAGVAATLGLWPGGPPLVVHVRDCLPTGGTADLTRALVRRGASVVLANSRYTADNFARTKAAKVTVAPSPVDLKRFDPDRVDRVRARTALNLGAEPALAVIAQITPWKGQATAVEALALLEEEGVRARLLIVGSVKFASAATRYDNPAYLQALHARVADRGLTDRVVFTGERADVPELMRAIDVLLVPSWEEPFGRSVIEAMAMGTPVVATSVGGPAEVIADGVNGRLVEPRSPASWASALGELLADPDLLRGMAEAGRRTAVQFERGNHVEQVLAVYRQALSSAS